jgi:hypothetical protein
MESGVGAPAFRWGEEDDDTWLDFIDEIGYVISLRNSKFTIKSGRLYAVGDFQEHIEYLTIKRNMDYSINRWKNLFNHSLKERNDYKSYHLNMV